MKKILLVSILLIYSLNVSAQNSCNSLPNSFSTYSDAERQIYNTSFYFVDKCNTGGSSWIKAASFYSCDGKSGFMFIVTSSETYIHQNLPISLWQNFKRANSFGGFYTSYIRGNYHLRTN
jgi:hypothetical protein